MTRARSLRWTGGEPRRIVFLAAQQTQILDVAGPFQVFVRAAELFAEDDPAGRAPYEVHLLSCARDGIVATNCGLGLAGATDWRDFDGPIDTLLAAGGTGLEAAARDEALLEWLRGAAGRARRIGSICTGAFLLAAAGLLGGKRVATHWKACAELAARFEALTVDPDPIYIRDGDTYTSAGITAGMDLALALVEDDLGPATALAVAREMVLYLRRSGGQSQYSAALRLQASDHNRFGELRGWAGENLKQDMQVERLAARAGMSTRNFSRAFAKDCGITPAQYVERLRVEAARRRLEESTDQLAKVADDCGFHSVQGLRRSFLRVLAVPPNDYRCRFATLE